MTKYCVTCTKEKVEKPKKASFNTKGEKPLYCKSHKLDDMVNVSEKNCVDCDLVRPYFNYPGEKALYCLTCSSKYIGMVNVKSFKCVTTTCNKKPSFNYPGLPPQYCKGCATEGMVNTNNKQCRSDGCISAPNFNLPGEIGGIYCSTHAPSGYIDVNHVKCLELNCDKSPSYNVQGNTVPAYCSIHAKSNMVNVKHPMCKSCTLFVIRPNINENLCWNCYIGAYPDTLRVKNYLTKERHIVAFFKEHYPNYVWVYNRNLNSCARGPRPDLLVDFGSFVVIIEVDEHQHKHSIYIECDEKRTTDISVKLDKPLVMLRINPDSYKDANGKVQKGMFNKDKNNKLSIDLDIWNERKLIIESTFNRLIQNPPDDNDLLTTEKLFFDGFQV